MANGDRTILYVDKVELDKYTADGQRIFNVAVYKNTNTSGAISFNSILTTETYDNGDGTVGTHVSMFNTANISLDTIETINNKQYYKINAYIYIDQYEGYTYTKGQQLFFGICADTMANEIFTSENNFEQTVVEFDYDLNKVTPDYLLWDVTDGVESLKVSYTEPPHKIISEIQYPDETIYDIKDKNALNKSQITNCLLEVPQRIKLELNDGVLTLKAGSQLTYCDGRTIFIENDLSKTNTVNATFNNLILIYDTQRNSFGIYIQGGNATSGTTPPTIATGTSDYIWLDTNTNQMKVSHDTQATWTEIPLPIGVVDITPNTYTAIEQVFNGMGYIGSTVWVDKGVKGLIPNGRNADGTLRNIEVTTNKVTITNLFNQASILGWFAKDGGVYGWGVNEYIESDTPPDVTLDNRRWFDTKNNIMYRSSGGKWIYIAQLYLGKLVKTDLTSSISSFEPKQPFRALDHSDIWYDSSTQTLHIGG